MSGISMPYEILSNGQFQHFRTLLTTNVVPFGTGVVKVISGPPMPGRVVTSTSCVTSLLRKSSVNPCALRPFTTTHRWPTHPAYAGSPDISVYRALHELSPTNARRLAETIRIASRFNRIARPNGPRLSRGAPDDATT